MCSIEERLKATQPFPLDRKVALNIMVTEKVLTEKFNELLKPYEISEEQYNVLRILRGQKGVPASLGVIQERMISKNSNTTRILDKLISKNLATRKVCPMNRRMIEVLITAEGLALLCELDESVSAHNQCFAKNLTHDELEQLNELLEKYRKQND